MRISVIIPHLNQPEQLATGLDALAAQTGHTAEVEVIVVDNGSRQLPHEAVAGRRDVRLESEAEPGPGPARNRGVEVATGGLLAFIDADCRAAAGWLAAIETAFQDPATAIIGGDVRVRYRVPGRPRFIEPYEAIYSYRNEEHVAEGFSGTGNLAMRAEVMELVGRFGGIDIAEDRDWGRRAIELGLEIRFVPDMVVYHPARDHFRELCRKWDRHIAHDLVEYRSRPLGVLRWIVRAVAVAVSPLVEIPTVMRSPRVTSVRERWMAMACLTLIRLYRGLTMLRVVLAGDASSASRTWNR